MGTTDQQEKHHVISDVSSDDDARELANLGKKPVLCVCITYSPMQLLLTASAKLLSACDPRTLVLIDGYMGRPLQHLRLWASEWRTRRSHLWLPVCMDRLWLRCCHDGRACQHVANRGRAVSLGTHACSRSMGEHLELYHWLVRLSLNIRGISNLSRQAKCHCVAGSHSIRLLSHGHCNPRSCHQFSTQLRVRKMAWYAHGDCCRLSLPHV